MENIIEIKELIFKNKTDINRILKITPKELSEENADILINYWNDIFNPISNKLIENFEYYDKNSSIEIEVSKNLIDWHETVIYCTYKLNTVYLSKDKDDKFIDLVKYTQNHINRLQYQCNQLIFRKQQGDYEKLYWKQHKDSICALRLAGLSIFLAISGVFFTIFYGRPTKSSTISIEKKEYHCPKVNNTSPILQEGIEKNYDEKLNNQLDTTFIIIK